MKRMKKVLVAVMAVAIAMGAASSTLGLTKLEGYLDCLRARGYSDQDRKDCCDEWGGGWVEIYDADGELIDEYCDPYEADTDIGLSIDDPTDDGQPQPRPVRFVNDIGGTAGLDGASTTASPNPDSALGVTSGTQSSVTSTQTQTTATRVSR